MKIDRIESESYHVHGSGLPSRINPRAMPSVAVDRPTPPHQSELRRQLRARQLERCGKSWAFASSRARACFPWGTSLGDGGMGAEDRGMLGRKVL